MENKSKKQIEVCVRAIIIFYYFTTAKSQRKERHFYFLFPSFIMLG